MSGDLNARRAPDVDAWIGSSVRYLVSTRSL